MHNNTKGPAVFGPYRERTKAGDVAYRVVILDRAGKRTSRYYGTAAQAEDGAEGFRVTLGISSQTPPLAVTGAVDAFCDEKVTHKLWGPRTLHRTKADLMDFAATGDVLMASVDLAYLRRWLAAIARLALATQRSHYAAVAEFLKWCVVRGHLEKSPCDGLSQTDKPWLGKRARKEIGRGKPQLRNEGEVIRYLAAVHKLPTALLRVATALPVLTGMCSGELRHLHVGDVDFDAGVIHIRPDPEVDPDWDVKTVARQGIVGLPGMLVNDLRELCEGRGPTELVFFSNRSRRGGEFREEWLRRNVHRVCVVAGVRDVCAHGLRDTYATLLRTLAKKSLEDIGDLLRHGDKGETAERHYIGAPERRPALRIVTDDEGRG